MPDQFLEIKGCFWDEFEEDNSDNGGGKWISNLANTVKWSDVFRGRSLMGFA